MNSIPKRPKWVSLYHASSPLFSHSLGYYPAAETEAFMDYLEGRINQLEDELRRVKEASYPAAAVSLQELNDWEKDCLRERKRVLTGNYRHWCPSWDLLPIDETCPEWPCECASTLI